MKIAIIASDDKLYLPEMMDKLLSIIDKRIEIVSVILLSNTPFTRKESTIQKSIKILNVYGYKFFLFFLSIHLKNISFKKTIKSVCKKNSIPVYSLNADINNDESRKFLSELDCDIFLSVLGNQIFKSGVLRIPRLFCINMHSSYLPHYRGMFPTFWQLLHQEDNIGISIFRMDEGIDSGDIILQRKYKSNFHSLNQLLKFVKLKGIELVSEVLTSILDNNYSFKKNNIDEGSYFSLPKKSDVLMFKSLGLKLF